MATVNRQSKVMTNKRRDVQARLDAAANGQGAIGHRIGREAALAMAGLEPREPEIDPKQEAPLVASQVKAAIAKLFDVCSTLPGHVRFQDSLVQAAADVRRKLFVEGPTFMTTRDAGGMQLVAASAGVSVHVITPGERWPRHGIVSYDEIAKAAFDFDQEEPPAGGDVAADDGRSRDVAAANGNGDHAAQHKRPSLKRAAKDAPLYETAPTTISVGQPSNGKQRKLQPPPPASAAAGGIPETLIVSMIDVGNIEPNPFQPRIVFDETELAGLAESLTAHGQLAPIIVRLEPIEEQAYQIVDGERRWRAAKLAGWKLIRAEVTQKTDAEMAELAIVANVQRAGLNPIEKAKGLKRLQDEFDYTQDKLAKASGANQSTMSIHLRLLDLPEAWQKVIISGALPVSHARCVLPLASRTNLLKDLLARVNGSGYRFNGVEKGEFGSLASWAEEVKDFIAEKGESIDEKRWESRIGRHVDTMTLSAEQLKELDLIEIDVDGKPERFAMNATVFDKLWSAHVDAIVAKNDKQANRQSAKSKADSSQLSAAELKRKAEQRKQQLKQRIVEWKERWVRMLIGRAIAAADPEKALFVAQALILYFSVESDSFGRRPILAKQLKQFGVKVGNALYGLGLKDVLAAARQDGGEGREFDDLAITLANEWLRFDEKEQRTIVPRGQLAAVADALGVDQGAEWRTAAGGWLTTEYLELHSRDELGILAIKMQMSVSPAAKKSDLVATLGKSVGLRANFPPSIASSEPWPLKAARNAKAKPAKKAKAKR